VEFKDYYKTLGVDRTASQEDIQKAYRKLARKYHPDVNKQSGSEETFKEIGEAHSVLGDPGKREKYDQYGAAWKHAEQHPGFSNPFDEFSGGSGFDSFYDVLEHMFGAGRRGAGGGFSGFDGPFGANFNGFGGRGQDHEAELSVTLEEAARGGARTIRIPGPKGTKTVKVIVPEGVRNGERIRLVGQGGVGADRHGDLYLEVRILPHPRWVLDGLDLHTTVTVPPWKAALGGKVDLETLSGKLRAAIPEGISTGTSVRLRGQGYPAKGERGDLYVEVEVGLTGTLTKREKDLYNELKTIDAKRGNHGSQ